MTPPRTPSEPCPRASGESRQVQAVFWINVSTAGYGSNLTSGAAELTDLLGGLLLNSAGNLAGNLINETAELPTLGLSSNVLAALANGTYRNDGAYGTPVSTSKGPPPPTPWWDVVASDIWNAVSGVVDVVAKIVSVVWNSVVAAAAYLADAAAVLSTRLGITALVSQTVSALRAVGSAMWTALDDLLSFIWGLITEAITLVTQPLASAFSSALKGWTSSLFTASNSTVAVYNGTSGAKLTAIAQLGSVLVVPLLIATAVGVAVDIILGLAAPLDIGAATVLGFLAPIIIRLFESHLPSTVPTGWSALLNPHLTNSNLDAFPSAGSLFQWLFNQTHSVSSVTVGSWVGPPGDFWSLVAVMAASGAFISGLVAAYVLSLEDSQSDAVGLSATALIFGLISFSLLIGEYLVSLVSNSYYAHVAEFGLAAVAAIFGVMAVGAGVLGFLSGSVGFNVATGAGLAGVFLGLISLGASFEDLDSLYSET